MPPAIYQEETMMRKLVWALLVSAIALTALCPAFIDTRQTHAEEAPFPTLSAGQPVTADEMQAFFDATMESQMADYHVAGATISVVKDGEVLFTRGYGYADVVQGVPVDHENTVFILGSLSKLFTWTAVMQLAEQGKLDLDADVNSYLDFTIPDTYPQPITLNHLMAHNVGFEDRRFEQMEPASAQVDPLGKWLPAHLPTRVRPPGQFSAYANYGAALAGYIVERVSGMSYDDYVETNILFPLGMTHTTSRQPMPTALNARMSQGYRFVDGGYQPQPDLNVIANVAPAASFRSTASDMARFMIAHLSDGRSGDAGILQPVTARLMHNQSFTHDTHVNGMAHGFWEMDMNSQHIIGHAGSHFIFNSLVMLFPAHNLGVFVATNSEGGMSFVGGNNYTVFQRAFVDHFFPQNVPTVTPPADFAQHAERFSGNYGLTMGRSETTPEKLVAMLMTCNIEADKNGLVVSLLGNAHFIQIEPLVFRKIDDDTLLVFHEDSSGNVTDAFLSLYPQSALIKNRWFETTGFNLGLLALYMVLFLSFPIIQAITFLIQRRRIDMTPAGLPARGAQLVAVLVSLLSLAVAAGAFASVILDPYNLFIGHLNAWPFVSAASIVVVLLTLAMVIFTALAWKRRFWGLPGRIHYTLVALGACGFVWFMTFWNILGKSF